MKPAFDYKPCFEAFSGFSWKSIETDRIEEHLVRLRSRDATGNDCWKLMAGRDVCVRSKFNGWVDARICKAERRHRRRNRGLCGCLFTVQFYQPGDVLGDVLLDQTEEVGIQNIRILQGPYRLPFDELLQIYQIHTVENAEYRQQWSYDVFSLKEQWTVQAENANTTSQSAFQELDMDEEGDYVDSRIRPVRTIDESERDDSRDSSSSSGTEDSERSSDDGEASDEDSSSSDEDSSSSNDDASSSDGESSGGSSWCSATSTEWEADADLKAREAYARDNVHIITDDDEDDHLHGYAAFLESFLEEPTGSKRKSRDQRVCGKKRRKVEAESGRKDKHRKEGFFPPRRANQNKSSFLGQRQRSRKPRTTEDLSDSEGLVEEQGYVVSLSPYWRRHEEYNTQEAKDEDKDLYEDLWAQCFPGSKDVKVPKPAQPEDMCEVHCYELDEAVGLICQECGYIAIPIEKMAPCPSANVHRRWVKENEADVDGERDESEEEDELEPCRHPEQPSLQKKLYPHQRRAIKFMKRNIMEEGGGCILAHSPGTGKTLTSIAFYDMFRREFPRSCRLLILAPKSVLRAWEAEFNRNVKISVQVMNGEMTPERKGKLISSWMKHRGVLITTYRMFVSMASQKNYESQLLEGPELMILDEGHALRNRKTDVRQKVRSVKTKLRILLSGTLFQNNFNELFNVYYLARPAFIHSLEGLEIYNTDYNDDVEEDRARKHFVKQMDSMIAPRGAAGPGPDKDKFGRAREMLLSLTRSFTDHYKGGILNTLPGLVDYSVRLRLTSAQNDIYNKCKQVLQAGTMQLELAVTYTCIHPWLISTLGFHSQLPDVVRLSTDMEAGAKLKFVLDLIRNTAEKVLVFSEQGAPMQMLETMLNTAFRWSIGNQVLTLNGANSSSERQMVISKFNSEVDQSRVCLASIKACSEGIALTGASRIIFLHTVWNPSQMNQAISRAFRIGQTRKVYVYRLVADVREESNKYSSTGWKDNLANMIFDSKDNASTSSRVEEALAEDELLQKLKRNDVHGAIVEVLEHKEFLTKYTNE